MLVSLRSRNLKTNATRAGQGRPVLVALVVSTTLAFLAMVATGLG